MNFKVILASLLAILLVVTVVPMAASENSDALTADENISLNAKHVILYRNTTDQNSFEFEVDMSGCTSDADSVTWSVNVIGTPSATVVISNETDTTATVTGVSNGTIEILAYADEDNYASAVVVVLDSPDNAAHTFWFFIQIEVEADSPYLADVEYPGELEYRNFNHGMWIYATADEVARMFGEDAPFNAMNALICAIAKENARITGGNFWELDISDYGWINTFLGLGTYSDDSYTVWTYWAQFHASSGDASWTFNNYGLYDISTEEYTYMGLIFRTSYSANDYVPFPGVPTN